MQMISPAGKFVERLECINCGSSKLEELSGGKFGENPLRSFIEDDPWGESPLAFIDSESWSYVRCGDCDQMFHRRVLSPEWNEKRFSEWMSQDAIREFEKRHYPVSHNFTKSQEYVAHILRIEKLTRSISGGRLSVSWISAAVGASS